MYIIPQQVGFVNNIKGIKMHYMLFYALHLAHPWHTAWHNAYCSAASLIISHGGTAGVSQGSKTETFDLDIDYFGGKMFEEGKLRLREEATLPGLRLK